MHLYAGQVGYLITGMKTIHEARIGDTIFHHEKSRCSVPWLQASKANGRLQASTQSIVTEFGALRDAIEKLTLNDASVTVEKKSSPSTWPWI